jgi:hypothetical protein
MFGVMDFLDVKVKGGYVKYPEIERILGNVLY